MTGQRSLRGVRIPGSSLALTMVVTDATPNVSKAVWLASALIVSWAAKLMKTSVSLIP